MTRIIIHPVIPLWAIVGLLLIGAAGIWWTYGRCTLSMTHRALLIGVRLLSILILAALLLQPELLRVHERIEPPAVIILADTSASMLDAPGPNNKLRAENLSRLLESRELQRALERYHVHRYEFGADLQALPSESAEALHFNAPRTHILNAINDVTRRHRGANVAGILLLTDGLDQSAGELEVQARRVPLYMPELAELLPEQPRQEMDVLISDVEHPQMLVVNWKGQVDVTIKRTHGEGRLVCPVHLSQRGERIRSGFATFAEGETVKEISFNIEPYSVGRMTYRVDIEPGNDLIADNNSRQFVIDITDPRNRVLYLEGTQRWDFKFIKRALMREKNYHLSAFVRGGGGIFINFSESDEATSLGELPEFTAEKLIEYRVIILGEMTAASLQPEQQDAIRGYVEKGGALLFLGGERAYGAEGWSTSPSMRELLPFRTLPGSRVNEGRFSVSPTPIGRTHAILRGLVAEAELPSVLSIWGPVEAQAGASKLLEVTDGSPLLLVSRYGQGKVAALLSDSLWRWQLGAPQLGETKGIYDIFITQLVHWLSPQEQEVETSDELQIFTARGEAEVRESVTVGAVVGDLAGGAASDALLAIITLPDKRQLRQPMPAATLGAEVGLEQSLNGYRTTFVPGMPGEYQITVQVPGTGESAETLILVSEPQLELTGRPIDRQYLQQLAEQTGGAFVPLGEFEALLRTLPYEPIRVPSTDQNPLWNRAWILFLLLALFTVEWYARNKLDLV